MTHSTPSAQHRMKQAQETHRTWHKVQCCPYLTLNQRTQALAKAVVPSVRWEHQHGTQQKMARTTDIMWSENGCGHRKIERSRRNNSSRMVERMAQQRTHDNEQVRNEPKQRKKTTATQVGHMARADTDMGESRAEDKGTEKGQKYRSNKDYVPPSAARSLIPGPTAASSPISSQAWSS